MSTSTLPYIVLMIKDNCIQVISSLPPLQGFFILLTNALVTAGLYAGSNVAPLLIGLVRQISLLLL
jgi:hypothetical protein